MSRANEANRAGGAARAVAGKPARGGNGKAHRELRRRGAVAPSMREVPLESNTEALAFARTLAANGFDMVIFLTGVGTRALARVVETVYPLDQFAAALRRIAIVARGPKPVAALKELGVPVTIAVPEPNTWRDLLRTLDEKSRVAAAERTARGRAGIWRVKFRASRGPCGTRRAGDARARLSMGAARRHRPAARRGGGHAQRRNRRRALHHIRFRSSICCGSRAR